AVRRRYCLSTCSLCQCPWITQYQADPALGRSLPIEDNLMTDPYVIIGGDAAGMSAASKLKREQPDADVIVFERDQHISYSACGMPYWIGGVIESYRQLVNLTPEVARARRGIDVRTFHEVIHIDP